MCVPSQGNNEIPKHTTRIEARKLDSAESHRCGSIESKGIDKLRSQLRERMSSCGIDRGVTPIEGGIDADSYPAPAVASACIWEQP